MSVSSDAAQALEFVMTQMTIEEVRDQLTELIKKVGQGEEVVIMEGQRPVARLAPVPTLPRRAHRGSAKHRPHFMADDFDAPLEDFKDYME